MEFYTAHLILLFAAAAPPSSEYVPFTTTYG